MLLYVAVVVPVLGVVGIACYIVLAVLSRPPHSPWGMVSREEFDRIQAEKAAPELEAEEEFNRQRGLARLAALELWHP